MKMAILGTGDVGKTLGSALIRQGHAVMMGSRAADNESAVGWAAERGERASQGTFADAAASAEVILNCSAGMHSLSILAGIDPADLSGKVLIDVANPLDFSNGFPPRLSICNDDSLGEQIQRAHPDARVVKAFNTMANPIMTAPNKLAGEHQLLVCDDDGGQCPVARLSSAIHSAFQDRTHANFIHWRQWQGWSPRNRPLD